MLHGGCWIFLSHSSHDIEKVRIVRNEFERLGHNPLAFHLKCLSTDTEEGKHELDSLIKREIDAREWFVFCESPEAARSPYVRDEHAYIIDSGKQNVWTIDMTADIDTILNKVRKICAEIEVFISYAFRDRDKIKPLVNALLKKDFSVWTAFDSPSISEAQLTNAIERCTYKGFYIIVITQESVGFLEEELAIISSVCDPGNIIPVILGNPYIPDSIRSWLGEIQEMPLEPTEKDFSWLVSGLEEAVKRKIVNLSN